MKLGTNVPMGPLTLADFIGLDTCLFVQEVLYKSSGDSKYRPCPLLNRMVEAGWLGKKGVRNLGLLLSPDSVVRTKIRNGAYGDRPAAPARWLLWASGPAWLALATAAALGVAAARAGGRRALAVLLIGGVVLVHVATNATPRFRTPAER